MSPRDLVYVGHMLDMARKAVAKTAGVSRHEYEDDENLRLALTHLVQVIGEAARHVSREFTDSLRQIFCVWSADVRPSNVMLPSPSLANA